MKRALLCLAFVALLVFVECAEKKSRGGSGKTAKKQAAGAGESTKASSSSSPPREPIVWGPAVMVLTGSSNWTELVVQEAEHTVLVNFYSGPCKHCQELKPLWDGLAGTVQGLVKVGAVNCDLDENQVICNIYAPTGLPTITVFPPGIGEEKKPFPYRYERSPQGLIELVMGTVPRVARRLSSEQELDHWFQTLPELPRCVHVGSSSTLDFRLNAIAFVLRKRIALGQVDAAHLELASNFPLGKDSKEGLFCYPPKAALIDGKVYDKVVKFPDCHVFIDSFALPEAIQTNLSSTHFYRQFDLPRKGDAEVKEIEPDNVRAEVEEISKPSIVQFCHRWMPNCEAVKSFLPQLAASTRLSVVWVDLDRPGGALLFDRLKLERVPTTALFPGSFAIPVIFDGQSDPESLLSWVKEQERKFGKIEL